MSPQGPLTISVFGLTLPIRKWAVSVLSVLACVGVALVIWQKAFPSEPELVSQKQANAQMQREVEEFGLHLMEEPALSTAMPDSTIAVKVYQDGCVAVQRRVGARVLTKLVVDLARGAANVQASWWDAVFPTVYAQEYCDRFHHGRVVQQTYGNRNGCVAEVVRGFEDQCVAVQFVNTCSGAWDTNPNGTPRLRWRVCRH